MDEDPLKKASGGVLRMREALDVRDSLCLQLVLGNAKRGGDITHIRAERSRSRKVCCLSRVARVTPAVQQLF
jgi:uncharacterized protein YjhX (UPF0386 family)